MSRRPCYIFATAALVLAAAAPAGAAVGTGQTGPSTTVPPYVVPVGDGVETTSILTVGDQPAGNGYKMVGIPDGLGARQGTDGNFELLMTHELGATQGVVRAHGQKGSFVSRWSIDRRTLEVDSGADLIDTVAYWDYPSGTFGPTPSTGNALFLAQNAAFNRFCSATLTSGGQLHNPESGNGYTGRIFFGNEEGGDESRAFAITEDGNAQQLPRLGLFSWENTVPAANRGDTTLVQGQEDAGPGQIWTYVGTKTNTGTPAERAGLTNGANHVFDVVDEAISTDAQFRAAYGKGVAVDVELSEVDWNQSGAAQNAEAAAEGLTLDRIEDGHFDPRHPNDFYFLTTEGGGTTPAPGATSTRDGGGLWRLRYRNIERPQDGATLTLLLDGTEAPFLNKPDNMTIDTHGNLLIQEDPGNNAQLARVVAYDIDTGKRAVVAQFDPARFTGAGAITLDEESSGIIDGVDTIGDGKFLLDAQVHKNRPAPDTDGLVQEGQLLMLEVDDWGALYSPPVAGPAGPEGPQGPTGATGPQGPQGPNGSNGTNGAPGAAGVNGASGANGAPGAAGAAGPQGPIGPVGPAGRDGRDAGPVTCTLSRTRTTVTCRVASSSKVRSARLVRAKRTVARAEVAKDGTVRFSRRAKLAKGRYALVIGRSVTRLTVR